MAGRPFQVTVSESIEQLEKSLHNARSVSQKERLQMLVWLKQGEVSNRFDLAVRCKRDKATITRWLARYKQGELSPELNPIERFWLFLKKQLAWQNCPTLEELRQLLSSKLDAISSETMASLTSYDFILEALFGAASY